jgi:hypothetical protein
MNDVISQDNPEPGPIDIIENCIMVINECREWTEEVYDEMPSDKVKIMVNAFKLIAKVQRNLIAKQ